MLFDKTEFPAILELRIRRQKLYPQYYNSLTKYSREVLFHNKSPCCDYCCHQKCKLRHLEDPWYVLYLSTWYLELLLKKILTVILHVPSSAHQWAIYTYVHVKDCLVWNCSFCRLFRSDLPAWGYQYLGQCREVCLSRH